MDCSSSRTCPRSLAISALRLCSSILKSLASVRGNSPPSASFEVLSTIASKESTKLSVSDRVSWLADHSSHA